MNNKNGERQQNNQRIWFQAINYNQLVVSLPLLVSLPRWMDGWWNRILFVLSFSKYIYVLINECTVQMERWSSSLDGQRRTGGNTKQTSLKACSHIIKSNGTMRLCLCRRVCTIGSKCTSPTVASGSQWKKKASTTAKRQQREDNKTTDKNNTFERTCSNDRTKMCCCVFFHPNGISTLMLFVRAHGCSLSGCLRMRMCDDGSMSRDHCFHCCRRQFRRRSTTSCVRVTMRAREWCC